MKKLTASQLRASSEEKIFEFLTEVLEERIPIGPRHRDFLREAQRLPIGLRSMVTTHHLDVSLTKDDLGWHFGNWHDEALAQETAKGLEILGAHELASIFRKAFELAQQHWERLGAPDWATWYSGSSFEKLVDPLNDRAWAICEQSWNGILGYWVAYAKENPLEVGASDDA